MERTLAIVKPDAVERKMAGRILTRIESEGFAVLAARMVRMTRGEAEGFYAVHRGRPFFDDLTAYMASGPSIVMVLERADAIAHWRAVMGATDPKKAEPGTLRAELGESIERNSTHGSDAPETARTEIAYFFPGIELTAR